MARNILNAGSAQNGRQGWKRNATICWQRQSRLRRYWGPVEMIPTKPVLATNRSSTFRSSTNTMARSAGVWRKKPVGLTEAEVLNEKRSLGKKTESTRRSDICPNGNRYG